MSNLFILGTGFDAANKCNPSYQEFKKHLYNIIKENDQNFDIDNFEANDVCFYPNSNLFNCVRSDGRVVHDEITRITGAKILIYLMRKLPGDEYYNWNRLEYNLNKIEPKIFFDNYTIRNIMWENDLFGYDNSKADTISICLTSIIYEFTDWIREVNIDFNSEKIEFSKYIENSYEENIYINFNYTETLEEKYNISEENIYHLHGYRKNNNDQIILGSDNTDCLQNDDLDPSLEMKDILATFGKNVKVIIEKNEDLWKRIEKSFNSSTKNKIYVYGFGHENVDMPYIDKIVKIVDQTNTILYLNNYNNKGFIDYKNKWRESGFKGKIEYFEDEKRVYIYNEFIARVKCLFKK